MASLLALLNSTSSALNTAQGLASTASNNVSNANTPGYTRQTANLVDTGLRTLFDPGNVTIGSITQSRDRFLEAQVPVALGQAAFSQAKSDSLTAVSALDPSAARGLSAALSTFYSGLRGLSQNAGDPGLRRSAVASAQALASSFNQTSRELGAAQTGLDAQLAGSVSEVSQAAATVASLNRQIRTAKASGQDANNLLDARQRAQDRISELTGALPIADAQGDVSLSLPGGQPLVVGDQANTLSAVVDPGGSGHLLLQLRDGSTGAQTVASSTVSGRLGGWLNARDSAIADASSALDLLAFDVGNAINTVSRGGYALDASTGHDLFTVGAFSGAAGRIAVASDVAADPTLIAAAGSAAAGPGDATNLLAIIATETQSLSSGSAAGASFGALVSRFGSASAAANAEAAHDSAIKSHVTTLRESASGVSIDEELVNLQKAQRAYESISKVIAAAGEMLDTLLKLK